MIKLIEPELKLIALERDKDEIKAMLEDCEKEYTKRMKEETGVDRTCKLIVDETDTLNDSDLGGVKLVTTNGRIVCSNTVASKLKLVYDELLPEIREVIFPSIKS